MDKLIASLQEINWQELGKTIIHQPWFWPTVIGIIFFLYIWRLVRKKRAFIKLFSAPAGSVQVSQRALVDLVKKTTTDIAPESNPKICLCQKGGKLHIKVKLIFETNQNIESLSSNIQSSLFSVLKDTLGLENIGPINIFISGFKGQSEKTLE